MEQSLKDFIDQHTKEIKACFETFCYGDEKERQTFDEACTFITDKEKLNEFLKKYDDRYRTSLSQHVTRAWDYAKSLST